MGSRKYNFWDITVKFVIVMERPAHFQTILESESQRLNALCTKWQEIFDSSSDLTDELSGQILLAVGKFVPLIFISLSVL